MGTSHPGVTGFALVPLEKVYIRDDKVFLGWSEIDCLLKNQLTQINDALLLLKTQGSYIFFHLIVLKVHIQKIFMDM